jgi:hypothetical protein
MPAGQGRFASRFFSGQSGTLKNREGAMVLLHLEGLCLPHSRAWSLVRFVAFPMGTEKRPGLTRNVARNLF